MAMLTWNECLLHPRLEHAEAILAINPLSNYPIEVMSHMKCFRALLLGHCGGFEELALCARVPHGVRGWPVQAIAKELGSTPVDVVLHDGAPNVGGAWASEAYTQSVLVLEALRCATRFLVPNGAFVTKIFR